LNTFNEFLLLKEDDRRTGTKTGLYPLGYGGIGLYPDANLMAHSADAAFYISIDNRLFRNGDAAPFSITHLPGHKQYGDAANSGDNEPFDINHLPGNIIAPKNSPLPGKSISFKSFVKLVEKPKEISPPDSSNMPK
jgi:hypothetical protein